MLMLHYFIRIRTAHVSYKSQKASEVYLTSIPMAMASVLELDSIAFEETQHYFHLTYQSIQKCI